MTVEYLKSCRRSLRNQIKKYFANRGFLVLKCNFSLRRNIKYFKTTSIIIDKSIIFVYNSKH